MSPRGFRQTSRNGSEYMERHGLHTQHSLLFKLLLCIDFSFHTAFHIRFKLGGCVDLHVTSIVVVCLLLVYETYHPTHFRQTLVHGGYKYRAVVIYSNQLSLHSSSPHIYFRVMSPEHAF